MDRYKGYWINMTNATYYFYEGGKRSSSIPLSQGWNLVGYPKSNSTAVNESLNGLNFTVVKAYNSSTFIIYVYNATNNTLEYLEAYSGYWINSTTNQTWSMTG
jgi:hypothetical protein